MLHIFLILIILLHLILVVQFLLRKVYKYLSLVEKVIDLSIEDVEGSDHANMLNGQISELLFILFYTCELLV